MTTPDGGLAAAFLQMAQLGERTAVLEDGHRRILASLDDLTTSAARLAAQVAKTLPPSGADPERSYQPIPSVRWWKISGAERDRAVTHLRAWVDQVYRPHYGHLAAKLGPCWEEHPLALVQLDWLSELHSVLYFSQPRTAELLISQAEFGTRILPAFADQLGRETSSCRHRRPVTDGSRRAGER